MEPEDLRGLEFDIAMLDAIKHPVSTYGKKRCNCCKSMFKNMNHLNIHKQVIHCPRLSISAAKTYPDLDFWL